MLGPNWTIRFKGYLPVDDRMEERLRRVCAEIDKLPSSALHIDEEAGVITVDYSQVKGWLAASRQILCTVRVGEHIVVKPPWEDYEARTGDLVLEIDPGTSFGSGLHESTRLCLQALEKHVRPGITGVDFGTGTGILAIAAGKIGASRVIAFDADPDAVESARANVRRNELEGVIQVHQAESPDFLRIEADLMTANITAETIIRHLEAIARVLKTGGVLIASGMTVANAQDVEYLLPGAGFEIVDKSNDGHWVAVIARRV